MRLTVLGASASYAGPGQACAGYLVSCADAQVLVDAGNGVLSNLGRVTDPLALDAVVVTHAHPDHFADVYSMQAMLRYAPEGPAPPLALHGPHGLVDRMGLILSEHGLGELHEAFAEEPLQDGRAIEVGAMRITPREVCHGVETYALRIECASSVLAYTADSAYCDALIEVAEGADVLLAEATLPQAYAGRVPHLTPGEAAKVALEAGAGRLLLTHLWPTADTDEILRDAQAVFGGEVTLARELMEIELD